jgi:hypothetical protein
MVSFLQVFPPKSCTHFFLSPYALPAPSTLFFSIQSPAQWWVSNTDHEAPHYEVSSTPVTSSLLCQNILLNTFGLRSSLNVTDQVSHPYKTTGKVFLYMI